MYRRWIGIILLFLSLITAAIVAGNFQTFQRKETFAKTEDGSPVMDRIVPVPPLNSTEGWVGFDVLLFPEDKVSYEAYGIILPNNTTFEPYIVMRVVNQTGGAMLRMIGTDETVWDEVEIYGAAYLDKNRLVDNFKLQNVRDNIKYTFLFRGLKNETQSHPILIGVKEAWYEQRILLEPTTLNIAIIAVTAVIGLTLTVKKPRQKRIKRLRKLTTR